MSYNVDPVGSQEKRRGTTGDENEGYLTFVSEIDDAKSLFAMKKGQ